MSGVRDRDPLVVFMPSGKRGRFPPGTPVLSAAQALGVDVDSICGGRAICERCQVDVVEGDSARRQLACQAIIEADVVIDVPETSQLHRVVVRKPHEDHAISIDPIVRMYVVDVAPTAPEDTRGDLEHLQLALETEWGLSGLACEPSVIQDLSRALVDGDRQVTVAVRNEKRIVAAWPGFKERILGVAFDIGSTTLAAHLCDLASGDVIASAGKLNPQVRYGEDLMSRVSYVLTNPGGEKTLTAVVRGAMNELIEEVVTEAGADRADVLELTIVGNSIMHHLVLGISPAGLGAAPFALAKKGSTDVRASDIGIRINAGGYAYVLPCIAGHVGADAAGVLLAEAPQEHDGVSLVVDVGTNAEILLGGRERLLAASSPTGPAFEGAQISAGQRAAHGAIERVRIDRETFEPRFRVIGSDSWSDDPGFNETVTGICGSGIIEVVAEMFLSGLVDERGLIVAANTERIVEDGRTMAYILHDGDPQIRILQSDIRAIQLAKAALQASAKLLMEHYGVDRVDRLRLAGAFGAHIDPGHATVLGLIPESDAVSSAGNAAGTGARIALLERKSRGLIEQQVRDVEKIETATEPKFQEHFVASMSIPGTAPAEKTRARRRGRGRARS